MKHMKNKVFCPSSMGLLIAFVMSLNIASAAYAQTTANQQQSYWAEQARQGDPKFQPQASRGQALFTHTFNTNPTLASCTCCHTQNPAAQGKHVVTGKSITPLAPAANAQRFTDASKTEKWFKRNCNDVIGRECTAAEKADVLTYLIGVKS